MKFEIVFTEHANQQMNSLKKNSSPRIFTAVCKILGYMETNLRHQSLNTHKYSAIAGPNDEPVFESYVQNRTPGAYRIFWCYGPTKAKITILEISPHP